MFYKDGGRNAWIDILESAKEFNNYRQGISAWNKYYGTRLEELPGRMVFIENNKGEKVATATAFYDISGRDQSGSGWLHWVAVRRDHQGKGLSKPLISYTLNIMKKYGCKHAKIPTQTNTWLACKIYLDFGFLPIKENAVNSRFGWRIIKTLTGHKALDAFEPVKENEILF